MTTVQNLYAQSHVFAQHLEVNDGLLRVGGGNVSMNGGDQLDLDGKFTFLTNNNKTTTSVSGDTVRVGGEDSVTVASTNDVIVQGAQTTITSGALVINGPLTTFNNDAVSMTGALEHIGSQASLADAMFVVDKNTGISANSEITHYGNLARFGHKENTTQTALEVTKEHVTVGVPMEAKRSLTVKGDLKVEGTMITESSETRLIEDSHLVTNSNLGPAGPPTLGTLKPTGYKRGRTLDGSGNPISTMTLQGNFIDSTDPTKPFIRVDYHYLTSEETFNGDGGGDAGTLAIPAKGPFWRVFGQGLDTHVGKYIRLDHTTTTYGPPKIYQIKSIDVVFDVTETPDGGTPVSVPTLEYRIYIETSPTLSTVAGLPINTSFAPYPTVSRSNGEYNEYFVEALTYIPGSTAPLTKSGGLSVVHTAIEKQTGASAATGESITLNGAFLSPSLDGKFIRIDGAVDDATGDPLVDMNGIYQVDAGSSGNVIQVKGTPTQHAELVKDGDNINAGVRSGFTVTLIEFSNFQYDPNVNGWCVSDGTNCEKVLTTGVPSSIIVENETQSIALASNGDHTYVIDKNNIKRLYLLDDNDNNKKDSDFTLPMGPGISNGTTVSILATVASSAPGQRKILNAGGTATNLDFDLEDSYAQFTWYGDRWFRV